MYDQGDVEHDPDELPTYKKAIATAFMVVLVIVLFVWHDRLHADFWPLDSSRVGPNLVASVVQWAIVLVVAALLWPPTRRRIHRFADQKLCTIHVKLNTALDHHEAAHEELSELHRKMDHIIQHHPDIPPLPTTEGDAVHGPD
jgi:uncharacterized membrane protein YccC